MKKYLIFILIVLATLTTSCQAKDHTTIYIGDDGYWYINNEKTGSYHVGNDIKNAYDEAVKQGFNGTLKDWISLINNIGASDPNCVANDVKNAYNSAVNQGFSGSLEDWLSSINNIGKVDPDCVSSEVKAAYEIAVKQGFNGTLKDWLLLIYDKDEACIVGNSFNNVYESAVKQGFEGSLEDWISSITNKDGNINVIDRETNKNLDCHLETINGQVLLIIEYIEEVTIRTGVLAEIAYEGYSFYEIFEENNIAPLNMDSYYTETDEYTDYSGKTKLQTKVSFTPKQAMYVEGTTSQQAKSGKTYSGQYYIASKINCTRYEQGYLGIVFGTDSSKYQNTTVQAVTEGFVTASDIQTLSEDNVFIGSAISANLDGYIDDTVVVDLSIFKNVPSKEQLDELYERYLKIWKGEVDTSSTTEYVVREKSYLLGEHHQEYTDKEAKETFMAYMNKKAKDIGMQNTTFKDAAGFYNRTTAYDLLRLAVYACGYNDLVETWHKNTYTITVNGKSPRSVDISTTVKSTYLEDYYYLFGGKTGTVDGQSNLLCVVEGPDERLFACIILGADGNRFDAARQALDAAMIKYYDKDADNSNCTVSAKSAAVCVVPKNNTLAYTDYPLTILYEKDINSIRTPASITKVMTSICMLDFVADINESFMIKQNDITTGSGNYFYAGDIITYKEALHAMLLPSSNTTAEATATAVGHRILDYNSR